jgi:transcriptional regulator with XRE-family HTH domain
VAVGTGAATRFGGLLRRYRRAAGLSQEALAERARLSVRGVSALERGVNRAPRSDTLRLLESALGLAPEERAALAEAARPDPTVRHPSRRR